MIARLSAIKMKKFIFFSLLITANLVLSQEKKVTLVTSDSILKNIRPNENLDFWNVVYQFDKKDHLVKSYGKGSYIPMSGGFRINPHEQGFYYIAYGKGGKTSYVADLESLRTFIGEIDNGEEAALAALTNGYLIDFEFKDYAANYEDKGSYFLVDAGKVTSLNCPLAKTHFSMMVDKKSGAITEEKDLGQYFELYGKDCKNNPHYSALDKQMEQAKLRAEEQKKIQKEITLKMEKRLRKLQRKD